MQTLKQPSPDFLATGCGILFLIVAPYSSCHTTVPKDPRVHAVYDTQSGKLQKLVYDADNNGRPDAWSYMDGTRVVRIEHDHDEDGVIERWEYYDGERRLTKAGFASGHDGQVDTWVFPGPDGKPARAERSTQRDGTIDRTEFYEHGVLAAVEQDVDHDGRTDRWQTYADGRLATVAFDTTHEGVPDRRFVYRPDGSLLRIDRPPLHASQAPWVHQN